MKKSEIQQKHEYFQRYISLTDDVHVLEALQISLKELEDAPIQIWKALGDQTYAEGKWTVKDILQHDIDTERVFVYRITAIARADKQKLLSYDENDYAKNAQANRRKIEDLLEELILVRKGTIKLFESFTNEMLLQVGNSYNDLQYSPLLLGFLLAGHQRWHFKVLEEKYYPLLK